MFQLPVSRETSSPVSISENVVLISGDNHQCVTVPETHVLVDGDNHQCVTVPETVMSWLVVTIINVSLF